MNTTQDPAEMLAERYDTHTLQRAIAMKKKAAKRIAEDARRALARRKLMGSRECPEFVKWVSDLLEVHPGELLQKSRGVATVADARHVAMVSARRILRLTLADTAAMFGRTDHATVINSQARLAERPDLAALAAHVERKWRERK